jgi:hypothetical protein
LMNNHIYNFGKNMHNIFHLTYFSFLADPTSKVLQI